MQIRLLGTLCCISAATTQAQLTPRAAHHQHLFSPEASAMALRDSSGRGITARHLIALLDSARIEKALVLSVAYTWASANRPTRSDEYEKVKFENDWTSRQVAQYPKRLRVFCSVNPLKSWAVDEIGRCSKDPRLKRGLKLHFGNSDVDLDDPEKVRQARAIFAAANARKMPIAVHMRTSNSKNRGYGRKQAEIFLDSILAAAPDIPVQIAHLAGSGGYDLKIDSALAVFTEAIARKERRVKNLWFDVTTAYQPNASAEIARLIARRIREIGLNRVVFGSDAYTGANGNPAPREAWDIFRKLPLTDKEFAKIAGNVAPYLRD